MPVSWLLHHTTVLQDATIRGNCEAYWESLCIISYNYAFESLSQNKKLNKQKIKLAFWQKLIEL